MTYAECQICGMGGFGGEEWLAKHECPDPYPQEVAQSIWDTLVFPGSIVHPKTKARLQMSWRAGYAKSREEREVA